MIIEKICEYNPASSAFVNELCHSVIFEVVMALLIPAIGIVINVVIVRFIRRILRKIITRPGEFIFSNYVLCLGTVIHELSHALFALITGAKVTEVALFKPDGDSLGHVCFQTRGPKILQALQNSLSACAPVVVGFVICALMVLKVYPLLAETWQWIVAIYVFVAVLFHMNMSLPDLKFYFKGIGVLMLIAFPFCLIFFVMR